MAGRIANLAKPGSLLDKRTKRPKEPMGGKRPRERDAKHLAAIRETQTCLVCGYPAPVEAAHVSMSDALLGKRGRGVGMKSDDRWVLPLCSWHHMEQHREGELAFYEKLGVNPLIVAGALWLASPDLEAMRKVIHNARTK